MLSRADLLLQVEDFLTRVGDGSVFQYNLRLLALGGFGGTLDADTTWVTLSAFEADFKGYAPRPLVRLQFSAPITDGNGVYVHTTAQAFIFDPGGAGAGTLVTVSHAALTRAPSPFSSHELLDVIALPAPITFTVVGDMLERRYRRTFLTCAE